MASLGSKESRDNLTGHRFPAFLRTPFAWVYQRHPSSLCYEERKFLEHLVTVHPLKSLSDCGESKGPGPERNVLGPGPQPPYVMATPRRGQTTSLRNHVYVGINGDNLGGSIGKWDSNGAWTASQIQGACVLAETVALHYEIKCRMSIRSTKTVVIWHGSGERRGV